MEQQIEKTRKLAMKLNDHGHLIHAMCGHCEKLVLLKGSSLEEVNRVTLDAHSAQVIYNFDCDKCGMPNQLNMVVEDN